MLAQAEGEVDDTFIGGLLAYGVEVDGAGHARAVGIEAGAVPVAHHLLQDDGHLLLVDDVGCGAHVGLGAAVIYRGIHALDGLGDVLCHGMAIGAVGDHVGGIHASIGLVV